MADLLQSVVDGTDIIAAPAELDVYTSPSLRDATKNPELITRGRLVIDLTGTTFADPTGLGVLLGAFRRIRESGGAMAVACMHEPVLRSIRSLGLSRVLPVCDTVDEAIAAVKGEDGG